MNNNYKFHLFLLAIPVMAILFMNYSGGQVSAYSGSPGDSGNTCAVCHAGSANHNAEIVLTTDIPESGYFYSQEYTVTLSVTSDVSKHGFQVTAEKEDGTKVGMFAAGTGSQTNGSNTLVTHNSAGNSMTEWSFNWTAPATSGEEVTFYAVVNATNSNYQDTGDQVVTINTVVPLNTTAITEIQEIDFTVYPNPTTDFLQINIEENLSNVSYSIFDYQGKILIKKEKWNNTLIDISSFATGKYILKVFSDEKSAVVSFVKK